MPLCSDTIRREKGVLMCFDLLLKKYPNCRFSNRPETNADITERKSIAWTLLNSCSDSCVAR